MSKAICEDCGSLVEAELTHNGVCQVGHYVHCGWGHQLSPDDLISDAAAIQILHEQLKAARADAKEAEAYAEELDAKMKDIEQELLRRVKFAEESKKLAGSGTSQKREHYRMHALSEALGAVRNIIKDKARSTLAEIELVSKGGEQS